MARLSRASVAGVPLGITAAILVASFILVSHVPASQAQDTCRFFEPNSVLINVRRDPKQPGGYIDVLERGDTVCVVREEAIGNKNWAFISFKVPNGGEKADVNGWVNFQYLKEAANAAAAAPTQPKPAPRPQPDTEKKPETASPAPSEQPKAAEQPKSASAPAGDTFRYDQPVPFGAFPVQGRTLQELISGEPLFPPLEGLPEELWKKPCVTCHKWNQDRLCGQGKSYLKSARNVLRHQHPYGGPYKLALMRWAKTGCQ